jgi:deoxyribodipyrimidine photolyase-related protein
MSEIFLKPETARTASMPQPCRHLCVVLGDQLDAESALFDDFDPAQDLVWMCEARTESTKVWSHPARIAMFLSAMRHFADSLRQRGYAVLYLEADDLSHALQHSKQQHQPQKVRAVHAGEWQLQQSLPVDEWLEDRHFFCSTAQFSAWLSNRKQPRMEHFYRLMRQQTGYLMEDGQPVGGQYNFDADNRESFAKSGPPSRNAPLAFPPDAITQQVLADVRARYPDHPGTLDNFDWPVTREQALEALDDFLKNRLARFGQFQDAMWTDQAWPRTLLFHSRLSAALNLKLLNPKEVCEAALHQYYQGLADLASVEGFIRQILGWREYVRGIYWAKMPEYVESNFLHAEADLPAWFWTANTDYHCLHHALKETLDNGYAHHIQRLMVTGLFTLLLGVQPKQVHEWYLAVYVDAVEWVELPNVIGMGQHADGGFMASKPYIASGKYIDRMSNYCQGCRYDPAQSVGVNACPFTTLYWDFIDRHQAYLSQHPRLKMQVNNWLKNKNPDGVRQEAVLLRQKLASGQ